MPWAVNWAQSSVRLKPGTASSSASAFSDAQRRIVSAVAEVIIPRTDTPGAIDAGVPHFIELMVADWLNDQERDIFFAGLKRLEYRGYDSAGLAVIQDDNIAMLRDVGKLQNLARLFEQEPISGQIGIGHTRWATHGKPITRNAHPHLSMSGRTVVVHNGIVENYRELKDDLIAEVYETVYVKRWRPEWEAIIADRTQPLAERLNALELRGESRHMGEASAESADWQINLVVIDHGKRAKLEVSPLRSTGSIRVS